MAEKMARPEPIQNGPESWSGPAGKSSMIDGKVYVPTNAPTLPIAAAPPSVAICCQKDAAQETARRRTEDATDGRRARLGRQQSQAITGSRFSERKEDAVHDGKGGDVVCEFDVAARHDEAVERVSTVVQQSHDQSAYPTIPWRTSMII